MSFKDGVYYSDTYNMLVHIDCNLMYFSTYFIGTLTKPKELHYAKVHADNLRHLGNYTYMGQL